ncbi:hypothetical protein CPC08DRAFT_730695 [Agrocybe pediades]|nr:hypothetical protein CPC08DRAFT_730695 [Agrocybe pediades]
MKETKGDEGEVGSEGLPLARHWALLTSLPPCLHSSPSSWPTHLVLVLATVPFALLTIAVLPNSRRRPRIHPLLAPPTHSDWSRIHPASLRVPTPSRVQVAIDSLPDPRRLHPPLLVNPPLLCACSLHPFLVVPGGGSRRRCRCRCPTAALSYLVVSSSASSSTHPSQPPFPLSNGFAWCDVAMSAGILNESLIIYFKNTDLDGGIGYLYEFSSGELQSIHPQLDSRSCFVVVHNDEQDSVIDGPVSDLPDLAKSTIDATAHGGIDEDHNDDVRQHRSHRLDNNERCRRLPVQGYVPRRSSTLDFRHERVERTDRGGGGWVWVWVKGEGWTAKEAGGGGGGECSPASVRSTTALVDPRFLALTTSAHFAPPSRAVETVWAISRRRTGNISNDEADGRVSTGRRELPGRPPLPTTPSCSDDNDDRRRHHRARDRPAKRAGTPTPNGGQGWGGLTSVEEQWVKSTRGLVGRGGKAGEELLTGASPNGKLYHIRAPAPNPSLGAGFSLSRPIHPIPPLLRRARGAKYY